MATRARLLDAAAAVLGHDGLRGATTAAIASRAGVSQGALFKHFPTKHALLAAAVEDLFASLVADYRRGLAAVSASEDRIRAAVRLLWRIMTRPSLQAVFELMAAGRCDAALRDALEAVQARHRENLRAAARELFPQAAGAASRFDAMLDVVLSAMQGASLGALVFQDERADAQRLALLTSLARGVLERK